MAQPKTVLVLVLVLVLVPVSACRNAGTNPPPSDGSTDASGKSCVRLTTCDGTAVRACVDGKAGEVLEECGPDRTCSMGRCTSPSCASAEANVASFVGCTFYTFDLDNVVSDDGLDTSVLITNPGQQIATATVERRVGPGQWATDSTVDVAPMRSARIVLHDDHLEGEGRGVGAALRVTSDRPVSLAHVQSDDSVERGASSSGATLLLPAHVLGQRYRATAYAQLATPRVATLAGARGGAGQIVIVGTADATKVTVNASPTTSFVVASGTPLAAPGMSFEIMLDDGDLWQLFSAADGDDPSGTEITADKPVAVFSGNISTTYGIAAKGVSSPDLAHEQLLPARVWGKSFVAAALPPQAGVCDPLFDLPGESLWTFVADKDGTKVRLFSAPRPGMPPPPGAPPMMLDEFILDAGQSHRMTYEGSFAVTSTSPVQVMQGMDCEPTLSAAVATNPLLNDLYFAVLPGFDTMVALVRKPRVPLYLDGARLEESLFEPAGGEFEVGRVPIDPCPRAESVCTHHVEGQFGLTMRGMDVLAGWALTAPTWIPFCDPDVAGCQ